MTKCLIERQIMKKGVSILKYLLSFKDISVFVLCKSAIDDVKQNENISENKVVTLFKLGTFNNL